MKKIIGLLTVVCLALFLSAGKTKVKVPGGDDTYVPTLESNGKDLVVEGDIKADSISEKTTDSGVTVDGTLIKDGSFSGNITGNAATVTNGVYTTGDQTIGGVKTFSSGLNMVGGPGLFYETKTFTPSLTSATGTPSNPSGYCWRFGPFVRCLVYYTFDATATGENSTSFPATQLPFTPQSYNTISGNVGRTGNSSLANSGHVIEVSNNVNLVWNTSSASSLGHVANFSYLASY